MTQTSNTYTSGLTMAIFPNSLGFGYAVMKNALTLEGEGIVREKKRPVCNTRVLARIREKIGYYEPDTLVVEKTERSQKSKRIRKLIQQIIDHAEERNIKVFCYSREDIRFVFSNFSAYTKYEIACKIVENIPKMKYRAIPKRKPYEAEPINAGIFDAISLAITHFYVTE